MCIHYMQILYHFILETCSRADFGICGGPGAKSQIPREDSNELLFGGKKEWSTKTYYNMNTFCKHYAK